MSDFKLYNQAKGEFPLGRHRIAIVAARFNQEIVDALLDGALGSLRRAGAGEEQVTVLRVPGAFEIPLTCQKLAAAGKADALIALGCIIRGDTPHFEYVCAESARGIMDIGLKYDMPVINGILTVDTIEQARARAGNNGDNKGADAVDTALEMLTLFATL